MDKRPGTTPPRLTCRRVPDSAAPQRRREPCLQVDGAEHQLLGRGPRGGKGAELARHLGPVQVGVQVDDLALANLEYVAPLDVDPPPVRSHSLEPSRAVEAAGRAPAHRRPLLIGGHAHDLEPEVGEGREQSPEPLAISLWRAQLGDAVDPADAGQLPLTHHRLDVASPHGLEVSPRGCSHLIRLLTHTDEATPKILQPDPGKTSATISCRETVS